MYSVYTMTSARHCVHAALTRQISRFPDLDLAPLDTHDLSARDTGLANAIYHAVIQRWLTLTTVIESRLDREWDQVEESLRAVLLAGAAQLLLLDRIPNHAVINEAVQWAKQHVRPTAGGFVNAVLRQVATLRQEKAPPTTDWLPDIFPRADGEHWQLTEPVFDDDPIRRIAQQASHADQFIKHWCKIFGDVTTQLLARHNVIIPPIILTALPPQQAPSNQFIPHQQDGFFVFTGSHDELLQMLQEKPEWRVQDPTASAAVYATSQIQPSLIIDVCAGKGTKTKQLAKLFPQARVIASDIDPKRFAVLQAACATLEQVTVVEFDDIPTFTEQAELIVLDVPCSNTGVLARRPEAKYRVNADHLADLVHLQQQIITNALPLLTGQGYVLYSTCSIDSAENEQQSHWIQEQFGFHLLNEVMTLPAGQPGDSSTLYRDGGYYALLQRHEEQ